MLALRERHEVDFAAAQGVVDRAINRHRVHLAVDNDLVNRGYFAELLTQKISATVGPRKRIR